MLFICRKKDLANTKLRKTAWLSSSAGTFTENGTVSYKIRISYLKQIQIITQREDFDSEEFQILIHSSRVDLIFFPGLCYPSECLVDKAFHL